MAQGPMSITNPKEMQGVLLTEERVIEVPVLIDLLMAPTHACLGRKPKFRQSIHRFRNSYMLHLLRIGNALTSVVVKR